MPAEMKLDYLPTCAEVMKLVGQRIYIDLGDSILTGGEVVGNLDSFDGEVLMVTDSNAVRHVLELDSIVDIEALR